MLKFALWKSRQRGEPAPGTEGSVGYLLDWQVHVGVIIREWWAPLYYQRVGAIASSPQGHLEAE